MVRTSVSAAASPPNQVWARLPVRNPLWTETDATVFTALIWRLHDPDFHLADPRIVFTRAVRPPVAKLPAPPISDASFPPVALLLRFENVGLRYGMGEEVVSDVNFSVAPQSFQFLTGPSGAGKTTLLRLMLLVAAADPGNHPSSSDRIRRPSPRTT